MTAGSNVFQGRSTATPEEQQEAATREFDALVDALRAAGIKVVVEDDTPDPHTPDSIFPNNWVSFHGDGRVVLYPMEAPNRRIFPVFSRKTFGLMRKVRQNRFR